MFEVVFYKDRHDRVQVREYIQSLSEKQQNKIISYAVRLAQFGFNLKRPLADNLGGGLGLYELRPDRHRILYFFNNRTKAVLVHAFLKRTDEIPQEDIRIALKRKMDYLERGPS